MTLKEKISQFLSKHGKGNLKENITLEELKELKKLLSETKAQIPNYTEEQWWVNYKPWEELTGQGRQYSCFITEINWKIEQLEIFRPGKSGVGEEQPATKPGFTFLAEQMEYERNEQIAEQEREEYEQEWNAEIVQPETPPKY